MCYGDVETTNNVHFLRVHRIIVNPDGMSSKFKNGELTNHEQTMAINDIPRSYKFARLIYRPSELNR